jgi:hypothetical protein
MPLQPINHLHEIIIIVVQQTDTSQSHLKSSTLLQLKNQQFPIDNRNNNNSMVTAFRNLNTLIIQFKSNKKNKKPQLLLNNNNINKNKDKVAEMKMTKNKESMKNY